MSGRAWLGAEVPAPAVVLAPRPDADGVLADVPWDAVTRPYLRQRQNAIAAQYDALAPAQRARSDPTARAQARAAVDAAYHAQSWERLAAALDRWQAVVESVESGAHDGREEE